MKSVFVFILAISLVVQSQSQLLKARNIFDRPDSLRGQLTPLRTCYDINYYHLDVRVNPDERYISGSNQFQFTATNNFSRLQFDLFDNVSVDKVVYDGKELPFERAYNAVFIDFPKTIRKGQQDTFTVYYSGHPIQAKRAPWD